MFQLPVISLDSLSSYEQLRHAHLLLSLLTNCYVWQDGETAAPKVMAIDMNIWIANQFTVQGSPRLSLSHDITKTGKWHWNRCFVELSRR